jgi:hypothetical protein
MAVHSRAQNGTNHDFIRDHYSDLALRTYVRGLDDTDGENMSSLTSHNGHKGE